MKIFDVANSKEVCSCKIEGKFNIGIPYFVKSSSKGLLYLADNGVYIVKNPVLNRK